MGWLGKQLDAEKGLAALRPFHVLWNRAEALFTFVGGVGYLLYDAMMAVPDALFAKRGRRLGWANLWDQMVRLGVRSVPIVGLVLFCVGAILALQMAPTLRSFGVVEAVADIIAVAVFRELGPLIGAIVLTGFAGASIAAELGTMVVSEEVEALEASAISPIKLLVTPRVIACTLMMVCLCVIADLMGMAGGMLMYVGVLKLGVAQFITHAQQILHLRDFLTGLVKAGVFGLTISVLACYLSLGVSGGAAGVGVATTKTVVYTIVALIAIDLLFTGAFFFMGW